MISSTLLSLLTLVAATTASPRHRRSGTYTTSTGGPTETPPTNNWPGDYRQAAYVPDSTSTSQPLPVSTPLQPTGGAPNGDPNGVGGGGGGPLNIPAGCQHKGNVAVGWLPGPSENIGSINSALGTTACFFGEYAQITQQGTYSDASLQLTPHVNEISGGKTIFIASVMPSIPFNQVDETVAGGVANVLKKFTDQNIEVWLRFAHEMNWYVTDGTYHGNVDEFQQAWAKMSAAMDSNPSIKMFWSPNQASSGDLQQWFPKQGKVDMVGIDIYPKSQQGFGEVYGDFCQAFSTAKNLPFVIGETGAGLSLKEHWLGQVAAGDAQACPKYVGFSWFDYNKEEDFRVVEGSDIAKRVLGGG